MIGDRRSWGGTVANAGAYGYIRSMLTTAQNQLHLPKAAVSFSERARNQQWGKCSLAQISPKYFSRTSTMASSIFSDSARILASRLEAPRL